MDDAPCNKFFVVRPPQPATDVWAPYRPLADSLLPNFCQRRMRLPDREILATNGSGSHAAHIPSTPPSNSHQLPSWACLLPTIVVQYHIMSSLPNSKYICSERS
ncbi:hypothetical protein BDZ89DRAFT_1085097 [Hymenopellis radicata]|nr:hypothetical protein BDZ89DRAFT_1085097 [Hymenopellis radicata]